VQRLLPDGVELVDVVFMWRRSASTYLWSSVGAGVVVGVLSAAGYGSMATRLMLALAVGLAVSIVATDSRVLAHTNAEPYVFAAGRVRQIAVQLLGPLAPDDVIQVVGTNLVVTEWLVGTERFSVPRNFQASMTRLAAER